MRRILSILPVIGILLLLGSNLSTYSYETSNNVHSRIIDIGFTYDNLDSIYENSLRFTASVEIWNAEDNPVNVIYGSNCNPVLNVLVTSINSSIELVQLATCLDTVHTVEYLSGITKFKAIAEIHFSNYNKSLAPDSSYRIAYPVNGGMEFGVNMDIINGTAVVTFDTTEINWGDSDSNTETTGANTSQESETSLVVYTRALSLLFTFLSLVIIRKIKK